MGIACHKKLLLVLTLHDKARRQLVGDLLPGIVRQAALAHKRHRLLPCCRSGVVGLRVTWLLTAVDVANQRGLGHLRVLGGKSRRGRAPHGVPTDVRLFDPQMLHQGMHIAYQMIERVVRLSRRGGGQAMAARIIGNDPVALGEQRNLVLPQVNTGAIAMRQDQWESLAMNFVVQIDIVYAYNCHHMLLL